MFDTLVDLVPTIEEELRLYLYLGVSSDNLIWDLSEKEEESLYQSLM